MNACRFVSGAIEHWQSVHIEKDNSKKPVQKINSSFKSAETSHGNVSSTQSSQKITPVCVTNNVISNLEFKFESQEEVPVSSC